MILSKAYVKAKEGFGKGYPDELGDWYWDADCPYCDKACRVYAAHDGWWCDHFVDVDEKEGTMLFERTAPDRIADDHDRAQDMLRRSIGGDDK